jgi:hypothetical protein
MMPLSKLISTAAALNQPALAGFGRSAARKVCIMLAAGFVCVMAATSGIGFILWALWAYVRPIAGPVGAPLILAATAGLIAIIMGVLAGNALGSKQQPQYARTAAVSPEAMLSEAEAIIRKQKVPVLLAAVLAGIFAGSQMR